MSSTGHYRTVQDFPVHDSFTPGLADLITSAHQWVQTAVDLLGKGYPQKASDFIAQLQDDGLAKVNSGKAEMVSDYSTKLSQLDSLKSTLVSEDAAVGESTYKSGTIPAKTWSLIQKRVAKLVTTLDNAPAPAAGHKYLSASVEAGLQNAVLAAVADIHTDLESAHTQMVTLATSLSGPGATPASVDSQISGKGSTPWSNGGSVTTTDLSGGEKTSAQEIYQYLISKYHLTPAQAAGVVGNMQVESSLNTGAFNSAEGAYGLCQWEGGRLTSLQQYAASQNKSTGDYKVQVDFMMKELQGSESGAYSQLKSATTPSGAAAAFDQYYERSAGTSRNQRMADAENIAQTMSATSA